WAALWPSANESFKYLTISALVLSSGGPFSSADPAGGLSPVTAHQSMKLVAATCRTSSAKFFTPLNSLPGTFKLTGEKLNLSSGMASAAPTNSRSSLEIWRSITDATVGAGAGVAAGWPPCPSTPVAGNNAAPRQKVLKGFIGSPRLSIFGFRNYSKSPRLLSP